MPGHDAAVTEEDDEEQHSATAPPPNRQVGPAYYLQIRDFSPDGHRLQALQRLYEVSLFDIHRSGCSTYSLELL